MTHFDRSRSPFRERVMALAGHGTFREPTAPGSAPGPNPMPADHVIAAALAFGRRSRDDVGPDVASAMAVGRIGDACALKAMRWVGPILKGDRRASFVRARPWIAHYCAWALNAVIQSAQHHYPADSKVFRWLSYFPPAPEGMSGEDHILVAVTACDLLEQAAEDALALAARKWKAA